MQEKRQEDKQNPVLIARHLVFATPCALFEVNEGLATFVPLSPLLLGRLLFCLDWLRPHFRVFWFLGFWAIDPSPAVLLGCGDS